MNREQLKAIAVERRTTNVPEHPRSGWHCEHCHKVMTSEALFFRHSCPQKQKTEMLRTPTGVAAFQYFNEWMKAKGYGEQPIDTFKNSRYYNQFIKFVQFKQKIKLPNPSAFIRFMVQKKIDPALWITDQIFATYLRAFDEAVPPSEQFMQSIELLESLAAEAGVTLPRVFEELGFLKVTQLIETRKLSYWLLLSSDVFKKWMMILPAHEREHIAHVMNIGAAVELYSRHPTDDFVAGARVVGL